MGKYYSFYRMILFYSIGAKTDTDWRLKTGQKTLIMIYDIMTYLDIITLCVSFYVWV